MPKELVNTWNEVKKVQNSLPKDRAEELNSFSPFFSMLTVMGNAADIYDKNGNRINSREWQDRVAEQQQKKRSGETVSNDVFYLHSHENENEMYAVTMEYGEFNPSMTMNEEPISEQDRDIILVLPQKAKEAAAQPQAQQPAAEATEKILEAFDAYKNTKEARFPENTERNWETESASYFALLSRLEDEVNIIDKLGRPLDKEAWQNQIAEKQQNALDGNSAQSDTFYLQSNKNESVRFAMTVAYDGKTPTMTVEREPLSAKEWGNRIAAARVAEMEAQEAAAKKALKESAVDRFLDAWQVIENFKKTPGMENRGMDILSVNRLNQGLKKVVEITYVSDKDGNPLEGDALTSYLTNCQNRFEKGEKVPQDTFYLRCKDDISKMFELSVDYGKTKPTFALNKTPLSDKERAELTDRWMTREAFRTAGIDLNDLRARREQIANAPERLLGAFKGIKEIRKAPDFKRPNIDMTAMELRKNLENVQGIANVCDASGKALDGDAWYERIAHNELMRKDGESVPKDTFYLTCKDDNSKMFKVTVEYGKSKPKFKIDKTPVYEDERWRLRGEWQKNAVQADVVDPNAEDSPEKQNQKEKTAVAAKNVEKGAAIEKNAEKVAKNATETVITPSLDERVRAAGKDEHGYTEPSWKKYDVNAKKAGSGIVMEMEEFVDTDAPQKPKEAEPPKPKAEELQETKKILRTVEERDFSRIQTNLEKSLNPILDQKSPKELPKEAKLAVSFCKEIKDAAKENDSVRTMLVNMEPSAMQALYADYCEDVKKGVDPQLKGVLNETLRLDEAAKNGVAHEVAPDRNGDLLSESNEYHPIPNNDDVAEENKQIEEIQVGPQAGGV